jgi:hypothetical protein
VDVGSCYNPFASGPYRDLLDVTALDLRPTDPSVYQCDFLRLRFGTNDSSPVFISNSSSSSLESIVTNSNKISPTLVQLPEHRYDAVTMSLVLCYLPTPAARLAMIRQARRLLVHAESDDEDMLNNLEQGKTWRPHHRGLLVIFEKQSIMPASKNVDLFMKHWKEMICGEGFEFVRHELVLLKNDRHRSHGFVFRTTSHTVGKSVDLIHNIDMQNVLSASDNNSNSNFINTATTTATITEELTPSLLQDTVSPDTDDTLVDNSNFVPLLKKDGLYIKHDFWRKRDTDIEKDDSSDSTKQTKRQAI